VHVFKKNDALLLTVFLYFIFAEIVIKVRKRRMVHLFGYIEMFVRAIMTFILLGVSLVFGCIKWVLNGIVCRISSTQLEYRRLIINLLENRRLQEFSTCLCLHFGFLKPKLFIEVYFFLEVFVVRRMGLTVFTLCFNTIFPIKKTNTLIDEDMIRLNSCKKWTKKVRIKE